MLSDKHIRELTFEGKYISGKAKAVLTDPVTNKYIIKGSTGIGGTTAILNYNKSNYIIVSPNVGMIESKEAHRGNYGSDRQFFIYGESKDNWSDVKAYLEANQTQNVIINTTPDQIVNARDCHYRWMFDIPLFIDEAHLYVQDAGFRDSTGHFMELVYNDWKASFTLSTSTPFYNFWGIPKDVNIDYYRVNRVNQPSKQLDISYDKKAIKQFVYEQHELGRLVVIFTNKMNLHTDFRDLRVSNLVGDTLRIKLAPYKRGISLKELDYDNTDVLMLSSSYYAGFDIDHDCSILIISDQCNEAWKVNVNNIVQAYGRCRKSVHQALFVNLLSDYNRSTKNPTTYLKSVSELNNCHNNYISKLESFQMLLNDSQLKYSEEFRDYFVNYKYVNRAKLMTELIKSIDDYHLYNTDVLERTLNAYHFTVGTYSSENEKLKRSIGAKFDERIKNLYLKDDVRLLRDYNNIKSNLKNKTDGTFSPKLALEYLTAYLLSITQNTELMSKLNNKRIYAGEFYTYFATFLAINGFSKNLLARPTNVFTGNNAHHTDKMAHDILYNNVKLTDDWHMLYRIYQITNNHFPVKVERNLKVEQAMNDEAIYSKYVVTGSNRTANTRTVILKQLKSSGIVLNQRESDRLKRKIKENFNSLDGGKSFGQYYNESYLKKVMKEAIIFCLTGGKCGSQKLVDYREYNPFTALPKSLRSIIPIKYIEIDLSSANAQFVDILLETDLSTNVYENIMQHYNLTRNQAKWKYNSTLNNHKLSITKASEFYQNAGYPKEKALRLAQLTANTQKGQFFKLMTQYEQTLIELYNEILDFNGIRFHDALVVRESIISSKKIVLPTVVKTSNEQNHIEFLSQLEIPKNRNIHFHIGYYNNPELKYLGAVSSKVYDTDAPINGDASIQKIAS
ncbi:hypothetical protein [Psychroserpens sp.]